MFIIPIAIVIMFISSAVFARYFNPASSHILGLTTGVAASIPLLPITSLF